ncbi:hypothetical protein BO70DRAFT_306165 [Aspergillus heteromorphus CBS 117.55]|uniref:Uncharacterized protein n=1 Tax=Aspergillus heteromorphus CBS 117.55 TaxID=1448321 RepID=A0A317X234_9EURO|nr:uncharacterized protein BO70DRAFT_306165 [Aspergillus heteromorphus CBS 117.55]PWY92613.1 hypothetical protein BO70DRAFT_306165 [Aspergillus heteromorphus CBS 117.55]
MKRCLRPTRLPCLDQGSHVVHASPSILRRRSLHVSLRTGVSGQGPFPERRQWSPHFSAVAGPPIDRRVLQDNVRKRSPVPESQKNHPEAWVSLLEQYLPRTLRRDVSDPVPDPASPQDARYLVETIELATLLMHARGWGQIDLLVHLGFRLNNWPAVHFLMNRLLDGADSLKEVTLPLRPLSNFDWSLGSGLSLDDLTYWPVNEVLRPSQVSSVPQTSDMTSLDAFTERPFAQDHSKRFMAEVWQSLGAIVLEAADASPNESNLAMSCVFRNLARLHHSGAVSDRVYKYVPPARYQANFRPPGIHLLSGHIMNVLSDAAWLVHQSEVAAQAKSAGVDSPYLPFKMGVRELGPEIWLELILWCCVEHGHVNEGAWLVGQMETRTGDQAWKFQSWRPILDDTRSVWKTKIEHEEVWRQHEDFERPSLLPKRLNPAPFHGLGERTISLEVASALLDNLPNHVYLGLGFRGTSPRALLRHASCLKQAMSPSTAGGSLLRTHRASNWFTVRVVESGGLDPVADPGMFDDFLRGTSCVVPPWDADQPQVDEDGLARLSPARLYDETSALVGLIEYNVRFFSSRRLCGDAVNAFVWLQSIVDTGKMNNINAFFSSQVERPDIPIPTFNPRNLAALKPLETSMPQLSVITLAELLDLISTSRAFVFGDWLLFSIDADGPSVPPSAYGNQALAPSIIRYAAATKDTQLYDAVVRSLSQPISLNTHRALLNYRIVMHEWDHVTMMLEFIRDYRAKSWGHSNITALAAEIIRMDHAINQQTDPSTVPEKDILSFIQAKNLLRRFLAGEYNEHEWLANAHYQERTLAGFHRIFLSIPGALQGIAQSVNLQCKAHRRSKSPYIPATAFHALLSAVVDTQGSAAGTRLWVDLCLDMKSPATLRLQEGGIVRMFLREERNLLRGDPHFDAAYFKQIQKKSTIANPNTVRIIARAAVKEYEEENERFKFDAAFVRGPALQVLIFCIWRFRCFNMRQREINREVGGLLYKTIHFQSKMRKIFKRLARWRTFRPIFAPQRPRTSRLRNISRRPVRRAIMRRPVMRRAMWIPRRSATKIDSALPPPASSPASPPESLNHLLRGRFTKVRYSVSGE